MKRWRYPLLLAVQTVGAIIILWVGLPVYRQILQAPSQHQAQTQRMVSAMVAVVIIQSAYWLRLGLGLEPQWRGNVLFGHLVSFLARLSFIFGGASFSVVFFVRLPDLMLSFVLVTLAVLFSLFCYTLELERLAKAVHGFEKKTHWGNEEI